MEIINIIKDETVFLGLETTSREDCLETMIAGMERAGFVSDKKLYMTTVQERETKGSTGIGFGVAIPHGKSSGIAAPGLAFARLANPIDWNSLDGKPVQMVFLIGVPEQMAGDAHIKILVALSRKLIHEEFRSKLLAVTSSAQLYQILQAM